MVGTFITSCNSSTWECFAVSGVVFIRLLTLSLSKKNQNKVRTQQVAVLNEGEEELN